MAGRHRVLCDMTGILFSNISYITWALRHLYFCRARMFTFDQEQYPLDRLRAFVDGCVRARVWSPEHPAIAARGMV